MTLCFRLLLVAIIIMQLADAGLTAQALSDGTAIEGNPICAWLMEVAGVHCALVVVKSIAVLLLLWIWFSVNHVDLKRLATLFFLAVFYAAVIVNNFLLVQS